MTKETGLELPLTTQAVNAKVEAEPLIYERMSKSSRTNTY